MEREREEGVGAAGRALFCEKRNHENDVPV